MKRILVASLSALLLISFASVALAEVNFDTFAARSEGNYVVVTWMTLREVGCRSFVVERSENGIDFFQAGTVAPQGPGKEYYFRDTGLFKQSSKTFHYRVKAEMVDGTTKTTSTRTVTVSFSGIERTWGSLKAMFR